MIKLLLYTISASNWLSGIITMNSLFWRMSKVGYPDLSNMMYLSRHIMNLCISFDVLMVNHAAILKFIELINFQYFIEKLQHNANIPQGSHFLFPFLIITVQINKINLNLTSNLSLILSLTLTLSLTPSLTLTLNRNIHAKNVKNN